MMGSGFPDESASFFSMQNALPSKNGKSLASARIQHALAFPVAANQTRRLFGPRGNAARSNILLAEYWGAVSEDEDYAAWAAYRKAKKRNGEVRIAAKKGGEKSGKETHFEGFQPQNRGRNRRYKCNNEYHYAPRCPQEGNRSSGPFSYTRFLKKPANYPYSSIAAEYPLRVQPSNMDGPAEPGSARNWKQDRRNLGRPKMGRGPVLKHANTNNLSQQPQKQAASLFA